MPLHDPLTGLPTRRLFLDRVREALRLADRREARVAVVIWRPLGPASDAGAPSTDPDGRIHVETARRLRRGLRASDLIGRIAEDEFALLLQGLEDEVGLREALDRLSRLGSPSAGSQGPEAPVEHRAGAALYPDHGARAEHLLERARHALDRAVEEGRELHVYRRAAAAAEDDSDEGAAALPDREELEGALREGRFELALQPVVRLRDREPTGFDALVRLPRSEGRDLTARDLHSRVAETDLVERIDVWTLEATLRLLSDGFGGGRPSWLSVNLALETVAGEDFPRRLASLMGEARVEARRLVVELAAGDARREPEGVRSAMAGIGGEGVRISLDHVGSGPLPLAPLGSGPLHFMKIDPVLVRGLDEVRRRADLVEGLVELGHVLGAEVVADGVESGDELRWLRAAGCDLAQGFHLGEPRPATDGPRTGRR